LSESFNFNGRNLGIRVIVYGATYDGARCDIHQYGDCGHGNGIEGLDGRAKERVLTIRIAVPSSASSSIVLKIIVNGYALGRGNDGTNDRVIEVYEIA